MRSLFLLLLMMFSTFAFSQENIKTEKAKTDITLTDSVVLGLVEGVTEYLPVSSTGHLILANKFLKLDSPTPLYGKDGKMVIDKKLTKKSGVETPYTMKKALDAYAVIIQIGAILAVAVLYWPSILEMIMGFLGRSRNGLLLARNLIAAFIPAAIFGLLFHDFIEDVLFGVYPVIFALFVGGILMIFVQKKYGKSASEKKDIDLSTLTIKQSLIVGLLQCVALWPGTSRSMMTILGGYVVGLNPASAAKFSFLIGLITLSAASVFKIFKDGSNMMSALSITPLIIGLIVSFVSALICVKWLVGFLTRHGLVPFAWYRILLSIALLILFFNE